MSLNGVPYQPPFKVVVLDDDPTGVQTVHGCLVLTRWDEVTLRTAFDDHAQFFFVLTNTRAFDREQAASRTYDVAKRVMHIAMERNERVLFISRGDSTLRGHFPAEIDAIDAACEDVGLGRAQIRFLVPAFIEGRRITRNGVHYIVEDDKYIPVAETEFARDQVFGYTSSELRSFIEEKTGGRVSASQVRLVSLSSLRGDSQADVAATIIGDSLYDKGSKTELLTQADPLYVVSDAERYEDLDTLAAAVELAVARGIRVQVQSGASFVKAITHCPSAPLVSPGHRGTHGIVIVGSHVRKTTKQLEHMLSQDSVTGVEVDVREVLANSGTHSELLAQLVSRVHSAWQMDNTPVVHTSREELQFPSHEKRLAAGREISTFLVKLIRTLQDEPEYIIAKGGITSHDLLVEGTGVSYARVLGQIHPGVPIVRIPDNYQLAGVPFVIFPGNVGEDSALTEVWKRFWSSVQPL